MQTVKDIINQYDSGKHLSFVGFFGGYHPFSNFYPAHFEVDGHAFSCSEQYVMFRKAMLFGDTDSAQIILDAYGAHPKVFQSLGRKVQSFTLTKWRAHRDAIMYDAVYHKFTQNPDIKRQLINSNHAILVETSPFDAIWGIKLGKYTRTKQPTGWTNPHNWQGENRLGLILMDLRAHLTLHAKHSE